MKNNKGMNALYITIEETAEYLNLPKSYIEELIQQKKIRALFDGEQYLVNKEQFNTHLEQMEKYKQLVEEILNEPIPKIWMLKTKIKLWKSLMKICRNVSS